MQSQSPTLDGLAAAHTANEQQLHALEKRVERATSPAAASSASQSKSPSSLASALFRRDKGKSSSSSSKKKGSKQSAPASATASASDLKALENEVRAARDSETKLVSSAIGTSAEGTALNDNGQDEVLDLADQLLAQLDAREREIEGEAVPAPASSNKPGIVAPQPIPPPNNPAASLAVPTSTPSAHSTSPTPSASSQSSHKHGLGARIKEAFSPPSPSSQHSEAASASAPAALASSGQPHKNRHALRKEKKAAENDRLRAEAQAEVDAARASGQVDPALREKQAMDRLLRQWRLEIYEMEPDGHCMYSAVADQLKTHRMIKKADYRVTRKAAAEYMRNHMDDFLPYLPAEDEDGAGEGLLTPEGYKRHCDNVEDSSVWGSHTEVSSVNNAQEARSGHWRQAQSYCCNPS